MPKVKSKTAASRLAVLNKELAEGAEQGAREKAVRDARNEDLFVVDTKKHPKLDANANAAPLGAGSKALIYTRPAKAAKPTSKNEARIVEKLARRVAAGELLPAAHSDKLARKPVREVAAPVVKATEDVWADAPKRKKAPAVVATNELEVASVLIPPASLITGKRKRPFSAAVDREEDEAVAPEDAANGGQKAQKRPRKEAASGTSAGKNATSITRADAAAAAGLSYNPSAKDHKDAMFVAAKNQLALEAASKPHIQVALQPAKLLKESVPLLLTEGEQAAAAAAKAGSSGGAATSASVVSIKPKRADVAAARRPDVLPLPEELTGGLRTMRRVPAAILVKDHLVAMRSTGLIGEKKRKGKAASRVSNKRVKNVEFPRKPAAEYAPKDGEW